VYQLRGNGRGVIKSINNLQFFSGGVLPSGQTSFLSCSSFCFVNLNLFTFYILYTINFATSGVEILRHFSEAESFADAGL
jgi:hypothetical protein